MGTMTDWLAAIGTDATAIVAIGAAVVAYWAVKESRKLREDQARPFVVMTLEPSGASRHFLDLVVRNHGKTVAHDVQFSFDEPLRSTNDSTGYALADVKFLHDGIATLAPGAEYRVMFDSIPARHDANRRGAALPDSYNVTVHYTNRNGEALHPEKYVLDSALSRSAPYAQEYKLHDLVSEVIRLRETCETFEALKQPRIIEKTFRTRDPDERRASYPGRPTKNEVVTEASEPAANSLNDISWRARNTAQDQDAAAPGGSS